jgi:hypothetical protein
MNNVEKMVRREMFGSGVVVIFSPGEYLQYSKVSGGRFTI